MKTIKFEFSPVNDSSQILQILSGGDKWKIKENLINAGMNEDLIEEVSVYEELEYYEQELLEEKVLEFCVLFHKENADTLNETLSNAQDKIDEIQDAFFELIEEETETDFLFEKYTILLSPFLNSEQGIVNKKYDFTTISGRGTIEQIAYLALNKILATHTWRAFYQLFDRDAIEDADNLYWTANELSTALIIYSANILRKELNLPKYDIDENLFRNNPTLSNLKNNALDLFVNKVDFMSFISDLIEQI
jgi:hypothetical protein